MVKSNPTAQAERSPARVALAEAIEHIKVCEAALAENAAKREAAQKTRFAINREIKALEEEFPYTLPEIDEKRTRLETLNAQYKMAIRGRDALEEEEKAIKNNMSYAASRIDDRVADVLKEEIPFMDMIAKYRSAAIEAQNRAAEIYALIPLAGYVKNWKPAPPEIERWENLGEQAVNGGPLEHQWRAWHEALKTDPDALMPA
jgi:chromosome segregation ATPase